MTGQDCSGPDQGLNVNRIITFSSIKIFFAAFFVYMAMIEIQNRRQKKNYNFFFYKNIFCCFALCIWR